MNKINAKANEWRIYTHLQNPSVKRSLRVWVDCKPDKTRDGYVIFKENRIVVMYYYLPGYAGGRIFRTSPEAENLLPHVDNPVRLLMSAEMRKVARMKKLVHFLSKNNIIFEKLPDQFYIQFDFLVMKPKFHPGKIIALYEKFHKVSD